MKFKAVETKAMKRVSYEGNYEKALGERESFNLGLIRARLRGCGAESWNRF